MLMKGMHTSDHGRYVGPLIHEVLSLWYNSVHVNSIEAASGTEPDQFVNLILMQLAQTVFQMRAACEALKSLPGVCRF
jgi:hypothetical protein